MCDDYPVGETCSRCGEHVCVRAVRIVEYTSDAHLAQADCIMFGNIDCGARDFCDNCSNAVKKVDISRGFRSF